MSVYSKIAMITGEIGMLRHDGRNEFHRYSYLSAAQVKAAIGPLLAKHSLAMTVRYVPIEITREYAALRAEIHVYDGDTGESVVSEGMGAGTDKGDKSIMKAETAALKYALTGLFCIASQEDDPEADVATDRHAAKPKTKGVKATRPEDVEATMWESIPLAAAANEIIAVFDAVEKDDEAALLKLCESEEFVARCEALDSVSKKRVWVAFSNAIKRASKRPPEEFQAVFRAEIERAKLKAKQKGEKNAESAK